MRVGLGSGRAASAFVRALGARVRQGLAVPGVPTSENTARLARDAGVPLAGLDEGLIDLTVDGADEGDPRLELIKGYGAAPPPRVDRGRGGARGRRGDGGGAPAGGRVRGGAGEPRPGPGEWGPPAG